MKDLGAGGRLLAGFSFLLTGCAHQAIVPVPANYPAVVSLNATPFVPQAKDQCGPASLSMLLQARGIDAGAEDLRPFLFLPGRRGSIQAEMVAVPARYGQLAVPLTGTQALLAALKNYQPVVVLIDSLPGPGRAWHYAVVIGYDAPAGRLRLHSGTTRDRWMRWSDFERQWSASGHWGMTLSSPGSLPPMARAEDVISGALRLQRAGRLKAAESVFRSAVDRWPGEAVAWIGLANLQARHDPRLAETTLRQALDQHSRSAVVGNNLADLLIRRGCGQAALRHLQRVMPHAGVHRGTLDATLSEARAAAKTPQPSDCPVTGSAAR